MMKVTYIQHSGFEVEYGNTVLIFDYYQGKLPVIGQDKKVYVFVSHRHYDHYQRKIFSWADQFRDVTYILSGDIKGAVPASAEGCRIHFMGSGSCLRTEEGPEGLKISTLRSTDEGVAFLVQMKDRTVYHAGDLNWWHWEEETDRYNQLMKKAYQKEIGRLEGIPIDAAFVPMDPRLGSQYFWGLDWFMRHTDTKAVFPMHMQGRYDLYNQLMQETSSVSYRDRVVPIREEGQSFLLD